LPTTDARDVSVQRTGQVSARTLRRDEGTQRLARRVHPRVADALDEPHRARARRGPCLLHRRRVERAPVGHEACESRRRDRAEIAIPLPTRIGKSSSCDHPAPSVTVTLTTSPPVKPACGV